MGTRSNAAPKHVSGFRFASRTGRRKILAVSMVKDEEDIIESFVRYNCGIVDGLVVLDNKSTDATLAILRLLEAEGLPLVVLEDTSLDYSQDRKTTALARRLYRQEKPDFILLLDADEFVVAADNASDPRELLEQLPDDVLSFVKWRTYVPCPADDQGEAFFPRRMQHIREEKAEDMWKVILPSLQLRKIWWRIGMGNHGLWYPPWNRRTLRETPADALRIAHFPIRSQDQYQKKIAVGWLNILCWWNKPPQTAHHWELTFEKLRAGEFFSPQELTIAAKEYLGAYRADRLELQHLPMAESRQGGVQLRYTALANTSWICRVLMHAENLATVNARLTRDSRGVRQRLKDAFPRLWEMAVPARKVIRRLLKLGPRGYMPTAAEAAALEREKRR